MGLVPSALAPWPTPAASLGDDRTPGGCDVSEGLESVLRWVARQEEDLGLELVCAEFPDPERGDRTRTVIRMTTCVDQVPAHEILELLTVGAETVVVRCTDPVGKAGHVLAAARVLASAGVGRLRIEDVTGTSALAASEPEGTKTRPSETPVPGISRHKRKDPGSSRPRGRVRKQVVREVLDAGHMPIPRRQVLGLGAGPIRDLPDQFQSGPRRLNAALAGLLPASGPALDALNASVQLVAPGCTACNVCVRACPTDALSLRTFGAPQAPSDDDDVLSGFGGGAGPGGSDSEPAAPLVTTLLQDPAACDGCGICVQMCPENVLEIRDRWDWSTVLAAAEGQDLKPVVSLTTSTCAKCGTRFPTTDPGSLCPVCTFRRANPFSSRMPPGA